MCRKHLTIVFAWWRLPHPWLLAHKEVGVCPHGWLLAPLPALEDVPSACHLVLSNCIMVALVL